MIIMTTVGMVTIHPKSTPNTIFTPILLLLLPILFSNIVSSLEIASCASALGMESGAIKDSAISASSAYDSGSVGPHQGRLRNDKHGGAWCPRQMVSRDAKEYLEINLEELHVITGARTQGRFGNGQGQEYAEEYMIEYWRPGFEKWVRWKDRYGKELLEGNTNTFTVVEQKLDPPVIASRIRFLPYSDHVRTVCMRLEIIGCVSSDGLISYSVPQGVRRGVELNLSDRTYDGREENGFLFHGLGQLVDGQKGQDNFRLDLSGHGKGYEWVGWRNDTPGWVDQPLEILFEFDKIRNFSAVHLHTNNLFSKEVQVFSHAKAYFSIGGNVFNGEPVHFSYMPDLVLEHARNVTIKLHHRIGRFLKLQLHFSSRWILLSEISFHSVVFYGNTTEWEKELDDFDSEKEVLFQGNEVEVTSSKSGYYTVQTSAKPTKSSDTKQHIGFIIGVLTVVIVMLSAAIAFVVYRNYKIKQNLNTLDDDDKQFDFNKTDDVDRTQTYKRYIDQNSPIYADIPDIVRKQCNVLGHPINHPCPEPPPPPPPPVRRPTSSSNFLSQPPPVPPPPEIYSEPEKSLSSPSLSPSSAKTKINQFTLSLHATSTSEDSEEETHFPDFSRDSLKVIESFGEGRYGEVHLCKVNASDSELVLVYSSRDSCFRAQIRALAKLDDTNVAKLLGGCLNNSPMFAVREHTPIGDLCQFLQEHVAETATSLASSAKTLSYGCLIYMTTQIASAMKYLESMQFVHKDLATRNCLVEQDFHVKISDLGPSRPAYNSDYCSLPGLCLLPIRWMAWESLLLGKYTSKSDVWAFAITLWEILTFAREQPFDELSDEKVVENHTLYYQANGRHTCLNAPINSPKEIYDLMCECWQRNESDRPTFREIHLFLQRKNLGYRPDMR